MAKKHRGKKGDSYQYLNLDYGFLKSPAWRSLSGSAAKVWLELSTRYHGSNNGKLYLSLNEAATNLHMSKGTAQRAFVELTEKGFIALNTPGGWRQRMAHEYRITTKCMDTSTMRERPTNDWKNWVPKTKDRIK